MLRCLLHQAMKASEHTCSWGHCWGQPCRRHWLPCTLAGTVTCTRDHNPKSQCAWEQVSVCNPTGKRRSVG